MHSPELAHVAARAELAAMATRLLALVTAHDEVADNAAAMQDAALQFHGLLQVAPNVCTALVVPFTFNVLLFNMKKHRWSV
jgi:hypothetical protein